MTRIPNTRAGTEAARAAHQARAALRTRLEHTNTDLRTLLTTPGPHTATIGSFRLHAFLRTLPNIGPTTATRICKTLGINPSRRLRGLGARELERLLDLLDPPT